MKKLLFTLMLLSLVACSDDTKSPTSGKKPYDKLIVSNFIDNCVKAGTGKKMCACYVAELPTHIPQSELIQEEKTLVTTGELSEKMANALSAVQTTCATK